MSATVDYSASKIHALSLKDQHLRSPQAGLRYDLQNLQAMFELFKDAPVRVWLRLLGPFIVSGILGCFLMWLGPRIHYEFLKVLGDALVVAGIIGLCLEVFAASRIIEHASTHVAEKMAGYGLPRAAQAVIYDVVHKTKLVYREYRRSYRITRHDAKPGVVVVQSIISYRVVNNGKGKESYRPQLAEEQIYLPKILALQYGSHRVEPERLQRIVESRGVVTFRPEQFVTIAESDAHTAVENLKPEQYCLVRWTEQMEMPEAYSDVTAFTGMTVFPVIELDESEGFTFYASEDNDCQHVDRTWKYHRGFLAGQHVRAWWRPQM